MIPLVITVIATVVVVGAVIWFWWTTRPSNQDSGREG